MEYDFLKNAADQNARLECIKIAAARDEIHGIKNITDFAQDLFNFVVNGKAA